MRFANDITLISEDEKYLEAHFKKRGLMKMCYIKIHRRKTTNSTNTFRLMKDVKKSRVLELIRQREH